MTTFREMQYGPLGKAVADAMPHSEADPIGVYAATLTLWSSAINGRILQPNGRPTVFWSGLVGRSKIGRKGFALATARAILDPSIGNFLNARRRKGLTSGAALVNALFEVEQESGSSEDGGDGRLIIMEDEWASTLQRANRDVSYHDVLIGAWDGSPVANTTKGKAGKREEQFIEEPLLGYHAHIQPGRWAPLVKPDVALGGVFNRIPLFLVEKSKNISSVTRRPLDSVSESKALTSAYQWTAQKTREMELSPEAAHAHDLYRIAFDDRMASLPEEFSCFIERGDENILRVACLLTAASKKTVVPLKAWEAAKALIEYSMECTEKLVNEARTGGGRQMKTNEQVVREVLVRYAGECTRSVMLRAMGTRTNADGLAALIEKMPDVVMETRPGSAKGGPKPTIIKFADVDQEPEEKAPEPAPKPVKKVASKKAAAPAGKPTLTVVPAQGGEKKPPAKKTPAKRAAKKEAPARTDEAVTKQEVVADQDQPVNPMAGLL
ncbi:DUF3987 domain-containing protein [Streptomyces sp. BI20]|uniref:DUF3987 domain-containing protein n=1 Tax=Streptomyces sp. BI20 TaxID=3403460 RepID=UPI003C73AA2C